VDEILSIIPTIVQYAPAVAVLLLIVWFFMRGHIISSATHQKSRESDQEYISKLEAQYKVDKAEVGDLYRQIIAEKQARINTLTERLEEQSRLATIGLQYMVTAQQAQDSSAALVRSVEALLQRDRGNASEIGDDS